MVAGVNEPDIGMYLNICERVAKMKTAGNSFHLV